MDENPTPAATTPVVPVERATVAPASTEATKEETAAETKTA